MTKVTLRESENHFMARIAGHSGYGQPGHDLVCASVSMLSQTLMQTALDVARSDAVQKISLFRVESGNVALDLLTTDAGRQRMHDVFETIRTGFRMLEKNYPEYVTEGEKCTV